MTEYPLLPYVYLITEPSDGGYYTIEGGKVAVIPFMIAPNKSIVFSLTHSMPLQDFSLRCNFSTQPWGINIIEDYPINLKTFHLNKIQTDYTLMDRNIVSSAYGTVYPIDPFVQYFLNIQNLENRVNGFRMLIKDS